MCLDSNEIREKIPEQVKKLSNDNIFIETHGIYIYIYIYIFWYSEMSLSADREEYIIQENDDKKYYITGSDPTGIPIIWEKILGPTVK